MKTRGWILTVICSMLLLVAGITFASMVLVGQPALANESLWWWILINLGVMVLLFGYGVKRGIQILRIFSIPKSKLTREPGVVVCDYNISLKSMLCINCGTSVISVFLCCLSLYLYCIVYRALYCSRRAKPVQPAADLVLVSYLYLDYAACQTK